MTDHQWLLFDLQALLAKIETGTPRFQEVLRTPSLSCSIYHLPAGSTEMQSAHEEDELYLVLEGRARLRVGNEDQLVQKGSIMYVHTACDHAFFDIEEDLTVLAFFGAPLRLAQAGAGFEVDPDVRDG
ncbi:cupin domain-containing protein [uncultured Thiohalocapsa sp.]|jgi:mannose-6-phosphate isomerase-like protein (cupin superfamily)|uniref:cupin domain-containing protein n=1 Tax=uncultured Thiohalocapsa sp. TaxID=768990 RepID=UPI0025F5DED9|nr:cupin domain-containing protein [uncultured Thiohalocapsa sp.]